MTSVLSTPTDSPDIEHASRDRISTLQLERLRWSLQHAYDNVAHYTKAFDDAGVHPSDLKDLSDLAKFPFTSARIPYQKEVFGKVRRETLPCDVHERCTWGSSKT